jgi:hypothetical protein
MFNISKKVLVVVVILSAMLFVISLFMLDWNTLLTGEFSWGLISAPLTCFLLFVMFTLDLIQRSKKERNEN